MLFYARIFRYYTEPIAQHLTGRLGLGASLLGVLLLVLSAMSVTEAASRGQTVYEQACVACHGAGGEGALPGVPVLTGPTGPLSKPDGVLMDRMINGFQSSGSPMAMPPKGGNPKLTREDIEQVLRYMREAFGGT